MPNPEPEPEPEPVSFAAGEPPHANGKARERNPLRDAVVKITGADDTIQRTKGAIAKVLKGLKGAGVPYKTEEVLALPDAIRRAGMDFKLTVSSIPSHIHLVRAGAKQPAAEDLAARTLVERERHQREAAAALSRPTQSIKDLMAAGAT